MKTIWLPLGILLGSLSRVVPAHADTPTSHIELASFRAPTDDFGEAQAVLNEPVDPPAPTSKEATEPLVAKTDAEDFADEAAPASEAPSVTLGRIEKSLHALEQRMTSRKATLRTKDWEWEDLTRFQRALWRAMALDPANVSEHLIPSNIHPRALTEQLRTELDRLVRARTVAEKYSVTAEFDAYVDYCRQILTLRDEGLFRLSRVDAKRGVLEDKYLAIADKLAQNAGVRVELGVAWNDGDRKDIVESLAGVRQEIHEFRSDVSRLPASMVPAESVTSVKTLLWILIPLVFATGFLGGLIFRKAE